jgi:hypothetical protein
LISRTILGEEYRSLSSSPCNFLQPSFTPIQNNMQNYSSVYLNLCIFGKQTARQKILHQMTASILLLQSALNFFLNRTLIC